MKRLRERWADRRQRPRRAAARPALSLVALMDVFTILVFFFLVHSADGLSDAENRQVRLPESGADQRPAAAPVVMVTGDRILVQGEALPRTDLRDGRGEIPALLDRLRALPVPAGGSDEGRVITIMGDRDIPFALLHRIMQTCSRAGYDAISLSVRQRSPGAG